MTTITEMITSGQQKQLERVFGDYFCDAIKSMTKLQAQRVLDRVGGVQVALASIIHELGKNPHKKDPSNYGYPEGYDGARILEEQAGILREQYQFLLKPLASVGEPPQGAEGFWVMPLIRDIAPPGCEHPYNYAVDFVLERLGESRKFQNLHEGKTSHRYLQQSNGTRHSWCKVLSMQGEGRFTPAISAQFGRAHRGESVDYVREDELKNKFYLGAYHVGIMLLTHPEREQKWEQLHIDCAGDEYSPDGDGQFVCAPLFDFDDDGLGFASGHVSAASERYGSASGFLPQTES